MTSQALSGVIALRLVSREGSPSLLEVRHTHTQPPDRRLELFFSARNSNRAPARQTT